MSAGQAFLKTTGPATAGAIVATSLPTPAHAASADSAAVVGFSSDGNANIYTADPDAFVDNDRLCVDTDRDQAPLGANDFVLTARGEATDARGVLVTAATLLSSTILQSTSS